jgi:protocatechuate 3,4-dioxygenase beta subunit
MEHDDNPAGRLLNRREMLVLLGGVMLGRGVTAAAQDKMACVARPQQMEGPFFVDTGLDRSDIRSDPATGEVSLGVPLQVTFRVSRLGAGACAPLPAAHVELWQCDAAGVYSGVRDGDLKSMGRKFLRGYQVTDAAGGARFMTIYPGWYPGRTVHLHFTIRTGRSSGRREEFTSQLYFDDALTDKVHALAPYAKRGSRPVRNGADGLYRNGGSQLLLAAREEGKGLAATFDIGLQAG